MLSVLGKFLLVLVKLLVLPLRLFAWLVEAITGEQRRLRERRKRIRERPPMSDQAFAEQSGISPDDVPVALATRQAVAKACDLPATVFYPDDALSILRALMVTGPDARWFDLGPDWLEVVLHVEELLELSPSVEVYELDECWQEAERKGEVKNLRQLAGVLADYFREVRKVS